LWSELKTTPTTVSRHATTRIESDVITAATRGESRYSSPPPPTMPSRSRKEPYPSPSQPSGSGSASGSSSSPGSRLGRSHSEDDATALRSPSASTASAQAGKPALPRHKIQALESFVKFGRKGKEREPDFPPEEWFRKATPPVALSAATPSLPGSPGFRDDTDFQSLVEETMSLVAGSSPSQSPLKIGAAAAFYPGIPQVMRIDADPEPVDDPARRSASAPDTPVREDVPPLEPMTLARRIQTMLSARGRAPPPLTTGPSDGSSSGAPLTADVAPADASMAALLTDAGLMNGKAAGTGVFALLDRLRFRNATPAASPPAANTMPYDDDSDAGSGVMLYAPLEPDESSEVELAASDCMSVFDDGETVEFERPAQRLSMQPRSPTPWCSPLAQPAVLSTLEADENLAPEKASAGEEAAGEEATHGKSWFGTFRERVVVGGRAFTDTVVESGKAVAEFAQSGRASAAEMPAEAAVVTAAEAEVPREREPVRTRVRWVPSPDKISFQAMWWGYRLCVPCRPPSASFILRCAAGTSRRRSSTC
jgi:hypothetical protein